MISVNTETEVKSNKPAPMNTEERSKVKVGNIVGYRDCLYRFHAVRPAEVISLRYYDGNDQLDKPDYLTVLCYGETVLARWPEVFPAKEIEFERL